MKNLPNAKKNLFADGFLLGMFYRKQALKYLFEQGNPESIKILIDAVDRGQKDKKAIVRYLSGLTKPDVVKAMVEDWVQHRQPWLTDIAVGKALTYGTRGELPLDEETGMVVAGFASRPNMAERVSIYGKRVLHEKPPFMIRFTLKIGWASCLEPHPRIANDVIGLLNDEDKGVQEGAGIISVHYPIALI